MRVGFEPTKPVTAWLVSSELISASHPPHQFVNRIYRITIVFQEKKYRRKYYFSLNTFQSFRDYQPNMAEEVVWIIESWETWWSLKEWVTEADVQRIQENARQIKKVAQQLKQDKKQNNQLAKFLSFLLTEISNEKIIKWLYDTSFVTIDPKTNIPYFRKSMNDIVVVWLFYPFYLNKAQESWISHFYETLRSSSEHSISWYIQYLQDLSDHYHDNIPISETSFVELLIEIIKEYLSDASDINTLTNKSDSAYKEMIYEKLYLGSPDSPENTQN